MNREDLGRDNEMKFSWLTWTVHKYSDTVENFKQQTVRSFIQGQERACV